jgi:hypothetical protein
MILLSCMNTRTLSVTLSAESFRTCSASINIVLLYSIVRTVVQTKSWSYHVSRLERRAAGCVRSSWPAYPVGAFRAAVVRDPLSAGIVRCRPERFDTVGEATSL